MAQISLQRQLRRNCRRGMPPQAVNFTQEIISRYFRMRWVTPTRPFLHPDKRYLFLHFPHAVFPMGSWLSMGLTGNEGARCHHGHTSQWA